MFMKRRQFIHTALAALPAVAMPRFASAADATAPLPDVEALSPAGQADHPQGRGREGFRRPAARRTDAARQRGLRHARAASGTAPSIAIPALIARCSGAGRRHGGREVRRRKRAAGVGARWRTQPLRPVGVREGTDDRPRADEQRARRSCAPHRDHRRRRLVRRARSRGAGARARDHGRHGVAHRRGRTHARRRFRPPRPAVRPGLRQRALRSTW